MPAVLNQIRRHGYSGKHISTGERSMLSAFQESAQAVEGREDGALVPFWRFFDTLERQLDHGIKQVFAGAREAAQPGRHVGETHGPTSAGSIEAIAYRCYGDEIRPP